MGFNYPTLHELVIYNEGGACKASMLNHKSISYKHLMTCNLLIFRLYLRVLQEGLKEKAKRGVFHA